MQVVYFKQSIYFSSSYLQLVSTTQSFLHHQIMVPQWCCTPLSVSIHSAVLRNILSPLNAHTSNRLHELYSWIWLYWTTLQPVCFPAEHRLSGLMSSALLKYDGGVMMSCPAQSVWLEVFMCSVNVLKG